MSDYRDSRDDRRRERRDRMRERWEQRMDRQHYHGTGWTGIMLVVIGLGIFLRISNPELRSWLDWPTLLIVIGLLIGLRKGFREGGWFVPIIIGSIFLLQQNDILSREYRQYLWPALLVFLGIIFILRPRTKSWQRCQQKKNSAMKAETITPISEESYSQDDFIDTTSIFGGSKKIMITKNFKGGDMVNIFGGSEIDLTQADMTGTAELEVTAIFGGATLVIPSHWAVKSEAVCIFGGIQDKRRIAANAETTYKTLIIRGTVIFGGIEIKSF